MPVQHLIKVARETMHEQLIAAPVDKRLYASKYQVSAEVVEIIYVAGKMLFHHVVDRSSGCNVCLWRCWRPISAKTSDAGDDNRAHRVKGGARHSGHPLKELRFGP